MEQRYNSQICDEQIRQLWQQQQTYHQKNPNFKTFTIDTPPPTISGSLHIGHIFSYTQTDLIARYKRMTGHNVFYPFGFDCNGLATERFVEKRYDTNVNKIGRQNFIDLCLTTTEEMKIKFVELWKTMGLSAQLEHTYSTIAPNVAKISQESFIILAKKGYIYRKNEPALFCTSCRTTVAQAELDDLEQSTIFYDIQFTTTDNQKIIIATTRPEFLISCVAILYHPDDTRYQHLRDTFAVVPLFGQKVKILADEQVIPQKGTGLVMVCTFGDKTDIEWYKKHKLDYKQSLGFDGKFLENIPFIAGLKIAQARKVIVEKLTEEHLILNQKPIQNIVNVHERCKTPIEYVILPQWFVRLVENKEKFLELSNQINWFPHHMKARFDNWVQNLSWDWCISRQRVFGIPFPVWYCNSCHETIFAPIENLPIDPQNSSVITKCLSCNSSDIRPEQDVMDTWNTSSLTPYICKQLYANNQNSPFEDTSFIPMSMRPQAHDIIRTWAFYTIAKIWMHQKTIAWNEIVISGYVLSENKEKISKSKNNAPTEPEKLLTQFPPDAIRFWAASGTLGHDTAFSSEQMNIGQKLLTKIWNALKFAQINIADKQIPDEQPDLDLVHAWMLQSINNCLESYHEYFVKNEFNLSLQAVEKVFWNDFCDNYIEIIKDQFFNPGHYTQKELNATYWTLREVSFKILQLYAPFLPHITEYLYQHILKNYFQIDSIHQSQLPQAEKIDTKIQEDMQFILEIIAKIRKFKTAQQLSLKTEITQLIIGNVTLHQIKLLEQEMKLIQTACKIAQIILKQESVANEIIERDAKWFITLQIN